MTDIFISYKREDLPDAQRIARAMTEEGFTVFFDVHDDVGIRAGETWDQRLEQELSDTKAVVVLWSCRSVTSNNVRDEARRAAARGILLPVMLDDCEAPLGLGNLQAADLRDWQGDRSDPHWRFLVDRGVRGIVEGKPGAGSAEVPPAALPRRSSVAAGFLQNPRDRLVAGVAAGLAVVALAATISLSFFSSKDLSGCGDEASCAEAAVATRGAPLTATAEAAVSPFVVSGGGEGLEFLRTNIERSLVELLWHHDVSVTHALVAETSQPATFVFEGSVERSEDNVVAYLMLKEQDRVAGTAEVSAPLQDFQDAYRSLPAALLFFMGRNPNGLKPLIMNQRPTGSVRAWWLFEEGKRRAALGETDEAIGFLDRARAVDPSFSTALWAKGDLLAAIGDPSGNAVMQRALAEDPDLQRYSIHTALVDPLPAIKLAALAADWEEVAPGLNYREINVSEYAIAIYAWEVDPEQLRIEIKPAQGSKGETVEQIRSREGALLAVNGGYWDEDSLGRVTPSGLFITGGVLLKGYTEGVGSGVLLLTGDGPRIQYGRASMPDNVAGGVQAGPIVIEPGGAMGIRSNKPVRAERTAACVTSKSRLMLMTVKGGISLYEMATLLGAPDRAFGFDCAVALNLGGGPTAQAAFVSDTRSLQIPGLWNTQSAIVVLKD